MDELQSLTSSTEHTGFTWEEKSANSRQSWASLRQHLLTWHWKTPCKPLLIRYFYLKRPIICPIDWQVIFFLPAEFNIAKDRLHSGSWCGLEGSDDRRYQEIQSSNGNDNLTTPSFLSFLNDGFVGCRKSGSLEIRTMMRMASSKASYKFRGKGLV